ncbi:SLOG family protein [Pseudoflavonifractor sp. 524-17]|uniref:SLOG family protein n=1 Tax=Pseudoflavonifractor sp. 524-17 TaxID=2304577 RepID=UPI001FAE66C0|nr:SLOG family protein [Pseudoflavonifractor sp. 524-17]
MLSTCAITGHRPARFKWKYNENNNGCKRLKKRMRDQFALLYEKGVRQFWVDGALGVDMWAGEILLRLKEQPEYKDIELMVALPFEGHNAGWDERSKKRLEFLIR